MIINQRYFDSRASFYKELQETTHTYEQGYFENIADYKTKTVKWMRRMGVDPYESDPGFTDTTLGAIKDMPPQKTMSDS